MEFKEYQIDFGQVKSGKKLEYVFQHVGEKKIFSVETTCGCITPVYDNKTDSVTVSMNVPTIPTHLLLIGMPTVEQTKKVIVIYEDNSREELSFKYTINK